MKRKIFVSILSITLIFTLSSCIQKKEEVPSNVKINMTSTAKYDESILSLDKARVEDLEEVLKIKGTYTNNNDVDVSVSDAFSVYAIQGKDQLDAVFDLRGKRNLKKKIKPGSSVKVELVFRLKSDDEVTIYMCTPDLQKYIVGVAKYDLYNLHYN